MKTSPNHLDPPASRGVARHSSSARKRPLQVLGAGLLAAGMFASPMQGALTPSFAATGNDGVMILNQDTLPRGAVWIDGAFGGHLWVTDGVLGICRVDAQAASTPPWTRSNCNGAVKAGGQIVVGNPPAQAPGGTPAGAKYVYVADSGTKSTNVVRFVFNPATETFQSTLVMNVQNSTSVGGGAGGGRPSAVALSPNGADLFVGYLKSGDIMKITGAQTTVSGSPTVTKVGTTSDGKGSNAFTVFNTDLYVAEVGGLGLSKISDPSGSTRPACSSAAQCTSITVRPQPAFFPGGLTSDGTSIYIGDAPRAGSNSILRYNPSTGAVATYSDTVPAYTSSFDGQTRSQYVAPFGLGLAPNGDLYVGDDATQGLPLAGQPAPATLQGHIWRVPAAVNPLSISNVVNTSAASPFLNTNSGSTSGGDQVTLTGVGFDLAATTVSFGTNAATNVTCGSTISCTATTPAGTGTVDVRVTVAGRQSLISAADQFTFIAPVATSKIAVTGVAPNNVITLGGTLVSISGQALANVDGTGAVILPLPTISFGAGQGTSVSCTSATACTARTPAGTAGSIDVQVSLGADTSAISAADRLTYAAPSASLYAWGITAPKGGAVWLPTTTSNIAGSTGHWWSSDHAQGLCRQDAVPGTTLHALNFAACGNDIIGSAGQAVYDPRVNSDGITHYVYVPDNAVKSTAVWRLTFDPRTETMIADPLGGSTATPMTPLADVRTLKPNGMALGPLAADGTPVANASLYVTDLVELNVRMISNPNGDPRTQAVTIVAQTGDLRGANGTQGFIGNRLYISENRGTSFFDVTQCPLGATPCGTLKIPLSVPAAGVFVGGTAVDATHQLVYSSDSPGGANAGIYRYDASKDVYVAFAAGTLGLNPIACPGCAVGSAAPILVTGGTLPAAGATDATVYCALSCTRPWDFANHPAMGGTSGFAFAFGLATDPTGNLVITEDPTAGARSGHGTMWMVPFIP